MLRDADELLLPQVKHTIQQLSASLRPEDSAAATLAEQYADAIDQTVCPECGSHREALDRLGPKLLTALESLGATPRARATAGRQEGGSGGRLAQLRAARQHPA